MRITSTIIHRGGPRQSYFNQSQCWRCFSLVPSALSPREVSRRFSSMETYSADVSERSSHFLYLPVHFSVQYFLFEKRNGSFPSSNGPSLLDMLYDSPGSINIPIKELIFLKLKLFCMSNWVLRRNCWRFSPYRDETSNLLSSKRVNIY